MTTDRRTNPGDVVRDSWGRRYDVIAVWDPDALMCTIPGKHYRQSPLTACALFGGEPSKVSKAAGRSSH